ncbi:MAG: DUF2946 family protein [Planctomycetota bacterium]
MRPSRQHWTALLLVLLHVLGPGLHWMQHAVEALHSGGGTSTTAHCGHASCKAKVAPAGTAERAIRAAGLDAAERGAEPHDHDCALCSQLHRLHGYVAPTVQLHTVRQAHAVASLGIAHTAPDSARPSLPPSRGPPPSLG